MRVLRVLASSMQPAALDGVDTPAVDVPGADTPERTVVLTAQDGEQFTLVIDDALIQACGMSSTIGGSDEIGPPASPEPPRKVTHLSPRDIQTRLRAGEAPEDLAAETGMDYDRMMRFGFAVMQERSRVGDEARRARARRDGDGALVPFGETVDRRFSAHGIDPADVRWDAFRRPDGSWTISATWNAGASDRQAYWAFSLAARTVLPADEAAADLLSDRPLRAVVRAVPDAGEEAVPARAELFDQESPAGYVRPDIPRPAPVTRSAGAGSSDPDAPADSYGTTPLPLRLADPLPSSIRLLGPVSAEGTQGAATHEPAPAATDSLADALFGSPDEDTNRADATVITDASSADDTPPVPRRRSTRERAKVPSWEDIYLGVKRNKD